MNLVNGKCIQISPFLFQYHEYITEEEAKKVLFDKETWDQYKNALWTRMTLPVVPMASDR